MVYEVHHDRACGFHSKTHRSGRDSIHLRVIGAAGEFVGDLLHVFEVSIQRCPAEVASRADVTKRDADNPFLQEELECCVQDRIPSVFALFLSFVQLASLAVAQFCHVFSPRLISRRVSRGSPRGSPRGVSRAIPLSITA